MENNIKKINGRELNIQSFTLKKKGKSRKIYKATGYAKIFYKNASILIYKIYEGIIKDDSNEIKNIKNNDLDYNLSLIPHAFVQGRSPVTNAKMHIGFDITISLDIKDFFGSITKMMLCDHLPEDVLDACFIDEKLPQGLSTSPVLSNIAMIHIDKCIHKIIKKTISEWQKHPQSQYSNNKNSNSFSYTRYADDISISFNLTKKTNPYIISNILINKISDMLLINGFILNRKKTKIMLEHNGYRTITGVSVNKEKIKATRKTIRRIRASIHKSNLCTATGLLSWTNQIKRAN